MFLKAEPGKEKRKPNQEDDVSAWSGKNCRRGHSARYWSVQERNFLARYEAMIKSCEKYKEANDDARNGVPSLLTHDRPNDAGRDRASD